MEPNEIDATRPFVRFQSSSVGDDGWNSSSRPANTVRTGFQSSSVGDDGWNKDFLMLFQRQKCFNPHPSEMTDGTRRALKQHLEGYMFQSSSVGDDGWNSKNADIPHALLLVSILIRRR